MSIDFNIELKEEELSSGIKIFSTREHHFGTDAFLLASFASPKHKEICCDFGTGCGIIPLYWAGTYKPKKIYAVDIMEQAIWQLNKSIQSSNLEIDIVAIQKDLNNLSDEIPRAQVDLITCNPPYKLPGTGIMSSSVSDQVARHETMCTIGDICNVASKYLKYGGKLCICQRPERLLDVMTAMRNAKIEPKRLRFVHQRAHKAPWLFLIEGRKNGKSFINIEKPLIIEGENGFSEELLKIYGKI